MLSLSSCLIATTADPAHDLEPTPLLVAEALRLYQETLGIDVGILTISADLNAVDWGSLWRHWRSTSDPKLLIYPGSIADSVGLSGQTLAEIAADWRIPVLLTVGFDRWTQAQIRAYQALLRQAGARSHGILLVESALPVPEQIFSATTPIWGRLKLGDTTLLTQARSWDWEGLAQMGAGKPDKVVSAL